MKNVTPSTEKKWKKYVYAFLTLGFSLLIHKMEKINKEKLEKWFAEIRKEREEWEKKRDVVKERAWSGYNELRSLTCKKDPGDLEFMSDCEKAWFKALDAIEEWNKENPKPGSEEYFKKRMETKK